MEKREIKKLVKKVQLEIHDKELKIYLETFNSLENLLVKFKNFKVQKGRIMSRITVNYLMLKDLEKVKKKSLPRKIDKKILESNGKIDNRGFIIFKNGK